MVYPSSASSCALQAIAPYSLFLDDDLILEPDLVERILIAIQEEGCGFVGSAFIGLSFVDDVRPHEQKIEFWDKGVQPETVKSGTPQWERWRLHNAANIYHVQQRLNLSPNNPIKYRVAWVAGCVMYDTAKLRSIGGYSFWQQLPPEHCGEDVLVQLRMMEQYGGCGIIPSGVYHQELPTTIVDRRVAADSAINKEYVRKILFRGTFGRNWRCFNRAESYSSTRAIAPSS